jgi:hypothetical protein
MIVASTIVPVPILMPWRSKYPCTCWNNFLPRRWLSTRGRKRSTVDSSGFRYFKQGTRTVDGADLAAVMV